MRRACRARHRPCAFPNREYVGARDAKVGSRKRDLVVAQVVDDVCATDECIAEGVGCAAFALGRLRYDAEDAVESLPGRARASATAFEHHLGDGDRDDLPREDEIDGDRLVGERAGAEGTILLVELDAEGFVELAGEGHGEVGERAARVEQHGGRLGEDGGVGAFLHQGDATELDNHLDELTLLLHDRKGLERAVELIGVDAAKEDGTRGSVKVVEPKAVGGRLDETLVGHGLREVGIGFPVVDLDGDFQCGIADAHDAFGGVGHISDPEFDRVDSLATNVENVRHVIAHGSGGVGVANGEFAVDVLVGRGLVGVVGARYRTGNVSEVWIGGRRAEL